MIKFKIAYEKWVEESLPGNRAGSVFGEAGNIKCQRRVIMDAIKALQTMSEPGTIQKLPYQWKRPDPEIA